MKGFNLDSYLNPSEKEQLENLLRMAGKRKMEEETRNVAKEQEALSFQFCFECELGRRKPEAQKGAGGDVELKSPNDDTEDLYDFEKLFRLFCQFCKQNNLCPECRNEPEEEEDDDFPL